MCFFFFKVMSNSLQPHGLYSPWNSLGQNTGVGSLFLLQGIFPTQESNQGLLHCNDDFLPTEQSIKNYRSILINTESGHDIISEKTGHKAEYSVVISFFKNAWECVYFVSIFRKNLGSLEQQTMNSSKLFTHGRTTEPTLSIKMLFNLKNKSISTFEKEQDLFSVATPITKSLNTLK